MGSKLKTKKESFRICVTNPKNISFEDFYNGYCEFCNSDINKNFLKEKGLTCEDNISFVDYSQEKYEKGYIHNSSLKPEGELEIKVLMKGANQGLIIDVYDIYVYLVLEKANAGLWKEYLKIAHNFMEEKFDPDNLNKGKTFIGAKNSD